MSISVVIHSQKAIQAGARWRVLDGSEQGGEWHGSGEIATGLEPHYYNIEFAAIAGWKVPQDLRIRNVEGYTNCKTVDYKPLSFYKVGEIPAMAAWHDQGLEFMIPVGEASTCDITCAPDPASKPSLDKETGVFRYQPAPEDKFPFSVTLSVKGSKKKQTFEITPMPVLPPEGDVFSDRPAPQEALSQAAPAELKTAPQAVAPPGLVLEADIAQGLEAPPPITHPFSIVEQPVTSPFLEIQPTAELAAPGPVAFDASTTQVEEPAMDVTDNEEEIFNHESRPTRNIRITAENLVLEQGSMPFDAVHANPAVKRLDIYAETVTIRDPLYLPQTELTIYARELRFEDRGDAISSICTTPLDFTTAAAPARREPIKDAKGNVQKNEVGQELYTIIKPADGEPGSKAGAIVLHIEALKAPGTPHKRFILVGGRGQEPGIGLHGEPGAKLVGITSYYQANLTTTWRIVYGIHYSKSSPFHTTEHHPWGVQAWPTDGEDATPSGIPGAGGGGGILSAPLDLASHANVDGGVPGTEGGVFQGGARGEPLYSVMVESWNKTDWVSTRGWGYLEHAGWNYHYTFPDGDQCWGYITKTGKNAYRTVGNPGNPGKVICAGHPLSWLHPLLLKVIMERAKQSYLLGDLDAAREKLAEYAEVLDIYQNLDAWNELDSASRLELTSSRNEIAGLISRLNSHLDYFGHPAGWVPMLSFEVNRTIFDNEIDRSIDILYLTYWLQEKAQDDAQRVRALECMEEKLKQEIEDLKEKFEEATETLPDLDAEAGRITNEMNLLQQKLKDLEDELRKKAEKQLEPPWWKTGLKIAGTLLSVVPVYQPALGAVGGLLNLGADFDPEDPWKTVTGAADVATTFAGARFTQKKADFDLSLKKVDTKSKEFKALKSAENLSDATSAISKGLQEVSGVLAERQAPKSEVDALLEKLKGESKEFQQLSGEISALLARKMDFARKIADALQIVAEIPNIITSNLLAIDSASSAMTQGKNALHDGRLTMHLHAMERRAKERLLKYHYYLAKSYQYRLLQPFPGTLDLERIFNEMIKMAELNMQGAEPYVLSKDQFDSLKAIYRDMLSSVTDKILEEYQQKPPELSAPRRFSLTTTEIGRLNAGETISMNLVDLGLFKLNEENIRIVDLEVESITVSVPKGGAHDLMEVDLRFEHSGISQLRSGGRVISFRHPSRETTNPITWGARYDVIGKKLDPIKPSADSDSLLRSLLKSDTADTMMLYSRPAVWADLNVSREVLSDSGVPLIKTLRLKVTYDYTRRSSGITVLYIQAVPEVATQAAELKPYFALDCLDLTGRMDGRGAFYRAYQGGQSTVQIQAQERYGEWKFISWVNQSGALLGMTPTLKVKVTADQVIKAVYRLVG